MAEFTRESCAAEAFCGAEQGHLWGAPEVRARLTEAAKVLRGMALGLRDRPSGLLSRWPEVVRQGFEAYGYDAARPRPPAPSPAAVSRADQAVLWLLWLDPAPRRIVWARAAGIAWRRLEDMDGRSHTTLRRIEGEGLAAICRRLNASLSRDQAVAAAFGQSRAATTKDMLTKFRK